MTPAAVTAELLAGLSPLSSLAENSRVQLLEHARRDSFARSRSTLGFDWKGKTVYLLGGQLKVEYPDGSRRVLVGGCGEAMAPLRRGDADPCNVVAITDVDLLWFDGNVLDMQFTVDQLALAAADKDRQPMLLVDKKELDDVRQLLRVCFPGLGESAAQELAVGFRRRNVKAGEVVVKQNEAGDGYYVIKRGRAVVSREVGGAVMELAMLQSGDAFGEEALIVETPRNATITMKTKGELLYLDKADFMRLLYKPLLHTVDMATAQKLTTHEGAVWLDVRYAAEFRQNGLRGAMNIPLNELRSATAGLERDAVFVVYCQSGRRSAAAAFLMSQRGFRVYLLAGGLDAAEAAEHGGT